MSFFKKNRKVFGMSFFVRMIITVLVVVLMGVSGTVLMAAWVDGVGNGIFIDNYGRIGIGKDNPQWHFEIGGSGSGKGIVVASGDEAFVGWSDRSLKHSNPSHLWGWYAMGGYTHLWDNINAINRISVSNTGNVGIGTSSPQAKLDVEGSAMFSAPVIINKNRLGGTTGHLQIRGASISNNPILSFTRYDENTNSNNLVSAICSDFTTTSDRRSADLCLITTNNGNGVIGMRIKSNGDVDSSYSFSAQSYKCTSDSRYKKNISLYRNALEKVLGLRGVTFFWNAEKYKDRSFGKEKQIGFIAQEVEKVIPEIVYTDDKGFKTMSYDRLTAVLVEAIKELKNKNDEKFTSIENENKSLKQDVASLKSENEILKQRLAKFESLADRLASIEKGLEKSNAFKLAER